MFVLDTSYSDFQDYVFTKRSLNNRFCRVALSSALNGAVTEGALDDEKEQIVRSG